MLAGGNQLQQQPTRLLEMLQTYLNGNGGDPRKDTLSAGAHYSQEKAAHPQLPQEAAATLQQKTGSDTLQGLLDNGNVLQRLLYTNQERQ